MQLQFSNLNPGASSLVAGATLPERGVGVQPAPRTSNSTSHPTAPSTWEEVAAACRALQAVATSLNAGGDRRGPRERLAAAMKKAERLVGPARQSRFGPGWLRGVDALRIVENHLQRLAGGVV